MIAKYAIALIVIILLAAAFTWAFLPARYLPGNRARHLRIRLHLRLHPGKGFAHVFSLHLRWGRFAALRRSARIRAALPLWYRIAEGCGSFRVRGSCPTTECGPGLTDLVRARLRGRIR